MVSQTIEDIREIVEEFHVWDVVEVCVKEEYEFHRVLIPQIIIVKLFFKLQQFLKQF